MSGTRTIARATESFEWGGGGGGKRTNSSVCFRPPSFEQVKHRESSSLIRSAQQRLYLFCCVGPGMFNSLAAKGNFAGSIDIRLPAYAYNLATETDSERNRFAMSFRICVLPQA